MSLQVSISVYLAGHRVIDINFNKWHKRPPKFSRAIYCDRSPVSSMVENFRGAVLDPI